MWGRPRGRIAIVGGLVVVLAALAVVFLGHPAAPELSERTRATGAPLTAEQRSVEFVHADLQFEVDPARRSLEGSSRLTLKVLRPIERIQFDLDSNLPVSAIGIGDQRLDPASWRNPDGQLIIELGRVAKPGEILPISFAYAGKPHIAAKPP